MHFRLFLNRVTERTEKSRKAFTLWYFQKRCDKGIHATRPSFIVITNTLLMMRILIAKAYLPNLEDVQKTL